MIPNSMQIDLIKRAHERGHFSKKATEKLIKQEYFIPDLQKKIDKVISNCIPCILSNKKQGKKEGFLHPLSKHEIPFHTYHVDYLGPLETTSKKYHYILAVIDRFTKFVWLYPTKSTTTKEVTDKLNVQKNVFGNPKQIISDRGTAFTSEECKEYCNQEGIKHMTVTTGLPRANGQVERLNRTIISVLTKLSLDDASKWYRHVNSLQQIINSTYHRSINMSPFESLFGTEMHTKEELRIKELIEEVQDQFQENRDELRRIAKEQINKG